MGKDGCGNGNPVGTVLVSAVLGTWIAGGMTMDGSTARGGTVLVSAVDTWTAGGTTMVGGTGVGGMATHISH